MGRARAARARRDTGRRRPSIETHPQFHLKLLLDRMSVGRGEVERWRWGGGRDAPAARSRAIANAMAPAQHSAKWQILRPAERRLTGVRALELADPAEEAQAIAHRAARGAGGAGPNGRLGHAGPGARPPGLCPSAGAGASRPTISAGRPLSQTPPGTLLLAAGHAAAERFAPVPLLALLKHPLVMAGEGRLDWLDGARLLDLRCAGRARRRGSTASPPISPTGAGATAGFATPPRPGGRVPPDCWRRWNARSRRKRDLPACWRRVREAVTRLAGDAGLVGRGGPAGGGSARRAGSGGGGGPRAGRSPPICPTCWNG